MKWLELTLPNGNAVVINPANIVSIRDATGGEIYSTGEPKHLISGRVATTSDFHFVRESVATIIIKLGELQ